MYQYLVTTRILFAVGIGLLIFSLVFGWISFAVPDWLQFYERANSTDPTIVNNDLKKFGLWYHCNFLYNSNDFTCLLWNDNTPTFVRVAQVLIPIGLAFSCLSFIAACSAFICTRSFITTVLFAALFAFLSFVFTIIGATVFANESLVYVERLNIDQNVQPRRWGMWLLLPYLILSFLSSIFFIISSILNWCDYRQTQVSGLLNHSVGKYNGSVDKLPSDNNTTAAFKYQFPYSDYPNGYHQINGLNNNNQQNQSGYPPPPPGYQPTPPGIFGYSRPGTPTMNPMYPYSNYDSHHHRNYMTENSEMDGYSRSSRRHRPRRRSRSHSHSRHRSLSSSSSSSPVESTNDTNVPKQTQFIPMPIPYYQPQPQPTSNSNGTPISYVIPQAKQQYLDETNQSTSNTVNLLRYNTGQPTVMLSNPSTQPVYTIAYRGNNGGNVLTGPAGTTYVTAPRNSIDTY